MHECTTCVHACFVNTLWIQVSKTRIAESQTSCLRRHNGVRLVGGACCGKFLSPRADTPGFSSRAHCLAMVGLPTDRTSCKPVQMSQQRAPGHCQAAGRYQGSCSSRAIAVVACACSCLIYLFVFSLRSAVSAPLSACAAAGSPACAHPRQ